MLPIIPFQLVRIMMPIISIPYLAGFLRDFYGMSSGRFMTSRRAKVEIISAGLKLTRLGYWRFIPSGDMPEPKDSSGEVYCLLPKS